MSDDPFALIPELGDLVTIVSDLPEKTITGRIVFRDEALIRVKSEYSDDRGADFPLDPETGLFLEALQVTLLKLHEKNTDPHFSLQLQVTPGSRLDFYSVDGTKVADSGIVQDILANDEQDAIVLEDGRILNFDFVGPPAPIAIIVPGFVDEVAPMVELEPEVEPEPVPVFDESLLAAPMVEEIPSFERTYNDAIQRDSMYNSFLEDIPERQQKNPRVLHRLNRRTDLLMALKNSIVVRNEDGIILYDQQRTYEANSVREALERQPFQEPLASLLPVAAVKKVVYTDDAQAPASREDVEVRPDIYSLAYGIASGDSYAATKTIEGNPFLSYMDTLLASTLPAFVPSRDDTGIRPIHVDQDVLRTQLPPTPVGGMERGLPKYQPVKGSARGVGAHEDYITVDNIGTIEDRSVRLIGASTFMDPKTGKKTRIAPADTGATVAHILLSSELAKYKLPTRSSVLLWDIQASEISRQRTQTFYKMMMEVWADQKILESDGASDFLLAEEIRERIPPVLHLMARPVVEAMDSFGLRKLEMNSALLDICAEALKEGTAKWDMAMGQLRQRALSALKGEATPVLEGITDSELWGTAWAHPELVDALAAIEQRDTAIAKTGSVRTAYMMSQYTLRNAWYSLVAQASQEATEAAVNTYIAERRRVEYAMQTQRQLAAELKSMPIINPCQHVKELEAVQGIREDGKRMALLQKFLDKYQAGQQNNWYMCGLCDKHLMCRHEVLLLNEFQHPGRGVALHKALLLDYSGPVFEGAYVCKNCGQKIADLEYDTHLEFDDEGRPLVGRTVIDPEDEAGMEVVLAEEAMEKDQQGYKGEALRAYFVARTVFEHCGINATKEVYDRITSSFVAFFAPENMRIPPREVYEKGRAAAPRGAQPPEYRFYVASLELGLVGALVALEILTSDMPVPFPAYGCTFLRSGFPLDKEGDGTMVYVACVIAGVSRNDAPWNTTSWAANSNLTQRQTASMTFLRMAMNNVLCIPKPGAKAQPSLAGVTDVYQQLLTSRRGVIEEKGANNVSLLPSSADTLPPQFRPAARVQPMEEQAIQNVGRFQQAVATGPIDVVVADVQQRQIASLQTVLNEFHTIAKESAKGLQHMSAKSDSSCCFQRLGAVAAVGAGIQALRPALGDPRMGEILLMETAAQAVQRRDPAKSANGSHFLVPWSAPTTVETLPQADASMYYRLFLKHCSRGEQYGSIHEFGDDNVCRHCQFQIPKEVLEITPADIPQHYGPKQFEAEQEAQQKQRKEIAIAAFQAQGIAIDEMAFHLLEDAIHRKKVVSSWTPPPEMEFQDLLAHMFLSVQEGPLMASAEEDWDILQKAYKVIQERKMGYNFQRVRAFQAFEKRYEGLLQQVQGRITELFGLRTSEKQRGEVEAAFQAFLNTTERVQGAEGARNMVQTFVVPGLQLATGTVHSEPYLYKWFPSITEQHRNTLYGIWEENGVLITTKLNDMDLNFQHAESKEVVQRVLQTSMTWLGSWLAHWISNIRVGSMSEAEVQIVLRWSILQVLQSLLMEKSPLYASVSEHVRAEVFGFLQDWCLKTLQVAGITFRKYQRTPEQIKEALDIRVEKERGIFIAEMDRLVGDDRKMELMKKRLGIGRWAIGAKKGLFSSYNADFNEFLFAQRKEMGIPEFSTELTGLVQAQRQPVVREAGYDHLAPQIEDA
jgi:hypothetical protein